MYSRLLRMASNQSQFLFGPRQVGKTTWLKQLYGNDPSTFWTDLLDTQTYLRFSRAPETFYAEIKYQIDGAKKNRIIVDEIQRIPALLNEVHRLIEDKKAQFILTGSSARKLKRGGANLLAGRAIQNYLFPLTFAELRNDFNLPEILQFGSLPALIELPTTEKKRLLQTYVETYLREEIKAEALVRDLGPFSRFLDVAAACNGEILNYSNVSNDCQTPYADVKSYYEIIEDTYLGFRLEAWRQSVRKRVATTPKFYLFDTGVANAINRQLTDPPTPTQRGRLFEHLMIVEVYRQLHYQHSEDRLYFWRTSNHIEVDLLIERGGNILAAIEFKSAQAVSGRDCGGLRSFHAEYPAVPRYLVADVPMPYEQDGILVLPWRHFLEQIPGLLEKGIG